MRAGLFVAVVLGTLVGCASARAQDVGSSAVEEERGEGTPSVWDLEYPSWLRAEGDDPRLLVGPPSPPALASGLRVVVVPDHDVPLVSFHVRAPLAGVFADGLSEAGRAAVFSDWLSRGAGGRNAEEFREAVESRGGSLNVHASARWIAIDAEFAAADAELGLGLVLDVVLDPALDEAEFRKAARLAAERLKQRRTEPSDVIGAYWNAWLFGGHAYGRPAIGEESSLERQLALDAAGLDALRGHWLGASEPGKVWVGIAGDVDRARMQALLEGRVTKRDESITQSVDTSEGSIEPGRVLLVDHPDSLQTYFRFGGEGIERDDPDHAARYLANTILGGRFTSRLNTALRIEAGLTYGAKSFFDDERGGAFAVNTYTETATSKECIDLAQHVYLEFVTKGMTAEELVSARNYVKGQFAPDELETPTQRAAWHLDLAIDEMQWDFIDGFFDRLDAVTLEDVNRVITTRFPRDDLCWVLIGQADVLRPIVEGLGEVTEIKLSDPGFGPRK